MLYLFEFLSPRELQNICWSWSWQLLKNWSFFEVDQLHLSILTSMAQMWFLKKSTYFVGPYGKMKLANFKNFWPQVNISYVAFDPWSWLLGVHTHNTLFFAPNMGKNCIFWKNAKKGVQNFRVLSIGGRAMSFCLLARLEMYVRAWILLF